MQPLTAPPRDGLTADEVTYLLRDAPAVRYGRGLEVLGLRHLTVVADISEDFQGGTVTRDNTALIHGACSLVIGTDIDYGQQLLRPYVTLTADGLSARFNCGVYVPAKPEAAYGASVPANQVVGSDLLSLLNRPIGDAYTTTYPDTYLQEVKNVIITSGALDVTDLITDGAAFGVDMPTPMTWPLLADPNATNPLPVDAVADSSNATTYLRVANALLAAVNYRGLWVDWDGKFRADPYQDPATRASEFTFDVDDALRSVIARERSRTRDITGTPNKWVFVQTNLVDGSGDPVTPTEGAGIYTVENLDDGDTSVNARGGPPIGVRTSVVELDAADQATLEALGDRQVAADQSVSETFDVSSLPFPAAWHEDIYTYADAAVGAGPMKVMSTGWTLDMGSSQQPAADMQHSLRRIA